MLEVIKVLLGLTGNDKDTLLTVLLEQAKDEAIAYTNNNQLADNIIIQMAIYKYNRLGTEGLGSESYSGMSFNYINDYPDNIVKQLKRYKKLGVITND
jgi:hypothetical protein